MTWAVMDRKEEKKKMNSEKTLKNKRPIKSAVCAGLFIFFLSFFVSVSLAQTEKKEVDKLKESAPKVFIECEACDLDFIKAQLGFVKWASHLDEAQVHVIISLQKTERGEEEYTLSFKGRKEFEGDNDLLKYRPEKEAPPEKVKEGLVQTLKMGLMRYVGKTPVSSRISVDFMDKVKPTSVVDKWNFWVFSVSADSFLSGQESYKYGYYYGSLSANRVTPELKIRLSVSASYYKDKYSYEELVSESSSESYIFRGLVVKSINDHWSFGAYFSASSSSYSNIKLSLSPAPAVEYNVFPYSESTKRQLRFSYRLNFTSVGYREETLYLKTYENLWQESLTATLELNRKWGTAEVSLQGSHYFHDFNLNRVELWVDLSLRLIKGLNFNIYGDYTHINDLLSVARQGASLADVILRRKQLETPYTYYFSVGLSYTFGSVKSKVVNPRFGSGGGISMSISM